MRYLGLVLAIYSLALAGVVALGGGAPPELRSPEGHVFAEVLERAQLARGFADREYAFAALLGGDRYDNVVRQYERLEAKADETQERLRAESALLDKSAKLDRAALAGDFDEIQRYQEYVGTGGSDLAEKLDLIRLELYVAFGLGLIGGLLVFFRRNRLGAAALVAGGLVPLLALAVVQPAPVEGLYLTGALVLGVVPAFKRAAV